CTTGGYSNYGFAYW
nr:immunoglobulin heavy chain junction region [Mus musculus]